ncbi:glutaminyl-peptide cyclotransferase [Drosophila ficusphila]|uniref:glutaminyl-peptide cyclotransferase n=1 Tax=Drosophila ficusphila TaxID=30025 RepID=UPI0007E88204|nr:glutaminyl-peptide cyclotransferase [Drosophila ficusphila]
MACRRGFLFFIVLVLIFVISTISQDAYRENKKTLSNENSKLNVNQMRYLAGLSDLENLRKNVKRIAVKRVVGTPEHSAVRNYIVDYLKNLDWNVELDSVTKEVPILGTLTFHNIVARQNPKAKRYLMLGCHYDSKYFKDFDFVATVDSAVPCAMMLNMATILKSLFRESDISLMFVFFDGEEAFGNWTEEDSLHGSQHLAKVWEEQGFLEKIDLLVLLDLIGSKGITFKLNIPTTLNWFKRFVQLELNLVNSKILRLGQRIFQLEPSRDAQDDHLPFIRRNVKVVHLIASEFPPVWHKPEDVEQNVDYNTTNQVDVILRMFVVEYLNLASYLPVGVTN